MIIGKFLRTHNVADSARYLAEIDLGG